jgi:hypothetical protein
VVFLGRKPRKGLSLPDFLQRCTGREQLCATFFAESRMQFGGSTNIYRKSGFGLHPLRNSLVETNHNLGIVVGMLAPGFDHGRSLFQRHNGAHGFVYRKAMLFEHANHFAKVFRQGIA